MRSPLCILASDKIALCFHSNTHSLSMSFSQRSSFRLSTMACMPAPHVCQAPVGCPGHWHYYLWESTAEKPIKNTGFVHVNLELAHTESRPYFLYYQIVLCFIATWRWRPHPLETVYCDGVFICSSLTDVFLTLIRLSGGFRKKSENGALCCPVLKYHISVLEIVSELFCGELETLRQSSLSEDRGSVNTVFLKQFIILMIYNICANLKIWNKKVINDRNSN